MHTEMIKLQGQLDQVNEELQEILTSNLTFDMRAAELALLRSRLESLSEEWRLTKAALLGAHWIRLHELVVEFDSRLSLTAAQLGFNGDPAALVKHELPALYPPV